LLEPVSGFEVVDNLRRHQQTAYLPILALAPTEITMDQRQKLSGRVSRVMERGAFTREQLLAEVDRALFAK
jgi:hypothetical protein